MWLIKREFYIAYFSYKLIDHYYVKNEAMTKTTRTSSSLILLIEILKRIPKSHKITASQLHQQLALAGINRDLRTIQRNLEMLCKHFDIIRDDHDKPYGYRWKQASAGLSIANMTAEEALFILLAI